MSVVRFHHEGPNNLGVAQSGQSIAFGARESGVQISPPRPSFKGNGMIRVYGNEMGHKLLKFPGGEVHIRFECHRNYPDYFTIEARIYSSDDIMELLLVHDALSREYMESYFHLICPYLPYARQDRVVNAGEPLSLAVMCRLINSLEFKTVTVWDVHSDTALALLDRSSSIPASNWVNNNLQFDWKKTTLVAPDAGARKKIASLAKHLGVKDVLYAEKVRNKTTGVIERIEILNGVCVPGNDILVVDDICDGGSTFNMLATSLNAMDCNDVCLYVTHGIFSQGLNVLSTNYDRIYCPHVWPNVEDHKVLRRL